eukprot:gnl/TRDRNA2_/TRDRNA2_164812_c0_seq1.p1 gnl/TRDRNA2_/TRDRNA2_164812_c0~~gnl/TRDRNA2_/TRDRNA2_164812_c0_seq1.p1  ORF type:complete len:425 (-),score=41.49 gnl/TRDRNA2_/TRDRNA2_164812_c0_seq1:30-1304(-)
MRILYLGAVLVLAQKTLGKLHTGAARIGGPKNDTRWRFVSKFGYTTGTGRYSLRARLWKANSTNKSVVLDVDAFLDEVWNEVRSASPCERQKLYSRATRKISIDPSGKWSTNVTGTVSQTVRPHIWFFALSDCRQELAGIGARIEWELRTTQFDGSEFSVEMRQMLLVNVVALLGLSAFVWQFARRCREFFSSAGSIHPVILALATAMAMQYLAQVCDTLDQWRFRSDGIGLKALEVVGEVFFMLSQVIQTSLLILIALGYTLLQSKVGDLDLLLPITLMTSTIHTLLVLIGKLMDDAPDKYHENDGLVGWIMLVLRILLYAWFLWAVQSTEAVSGMQLRSFLRRFRIAGSAYFLSYPIIFVIAQIFAPYLQHPVMQIGLLAAQMASNVYLYSLFLTRGDYFKVSTLNSSFLPGGVRIGLDKEE